MENRPLLTERDVVEMTTLHRSTIRRYVRAGKFPAYVKAGRKTLWNASEVQAWIAALPTVSVGYVSQSSH